jgi:hypothetical protein
MFGKHLTLSVLWEPFAICRLPVGERVPEWALTQDFFSITRTSDELSLVCPQAGIPSGVPAERGWRCLKVEGPLDFSATGILASLTEPLARGGVPVFATSTFDTDYLMLPERDFDRAVPILEGAGHHVRI